MSRATEHLHNDSTLPVTTRRGQIMFDLSSQQLSTLPESIRQLIVLETLDIDANQLTALPASLGQLTRLTACSVGKNHLTSLPESLWQLTNLHTFNVTVLEGIMAQAALADVTDAVHVGRGRQA